MSTSINDNTLSHSPVTSPIRGFEGLLLSEGLTIKVYRRKNPRVNPWIWYLFNSKTGSSEETLYPGDSVSDEIPFLFFSGPKTRTDDD